VKGNIVEGCAGPSFAHGGGIGATGIVTGNYVNGSDVGIGIGAGSTVTGNTVTNSDRVGITVSCPSNVTDNTVVNTNVLGLRNLIRLDGEGCNNTNNVAQ
jgi:hypothetical protein